MPRRSVSLLALLGVFLIATAGLVPVARGQETVDISFTGSILDSYGAKIDATAVLAFDPAFAYGQSVILESAPAATVHAFVAFPGIVAASSLAGDPNNPRFGGRLPAETICGDPGLAQVSEPEFRDPSGNYNCEPGSTGCGIRRRGNPVSGSDPNGRFSFAGGYGRSECDAEKLFAQTDQRAQNVNILPVGTASASAGSGSPPSPLSAPGLLGVSEPGGTISQQQPVYAIGMGSVRMLATAELRGPRLPGAPPAGALDEPQIAATGSFTGWLTMLGLLALGASAAIWVAARRLGRPRGLAAVGITLVLGANLFGLSAPSKAQETRRIVATVDARANDIVITAGAVEILRIAEVRVLAVTEANGLGKGAKATVSRTVRGVKVLGQDQGDASMDRINQALAPTGASLQLGAVTSNSSDDGTAASVDATGLVIEQKVIVPGIGGVQTPEYRLTLGRATPSVSFFSFSFGGLEGTPLLGGELPGEASPGVFGEQPLPDAGAAQPFPRAVPGAPGVTQLGPGRFVVEGKFAGFNFAGMSFKLWPLKDIAEAAGGALLLAGLVLAVRHRRRFA